MATGPQPQTAHPYDGPFCDSVAKNTIESLNKETEVSAKKIKELTNSINELEAKKTLETDINKIINDYNDSYSYFDSEDGKKEETKKVKKESIDNFKKLINSTLTLNALSLMLKENAENTGKLPSAAPTVKDLCELKNKNSDNSNLLFCAKYGGQNFVNNFVNSKETENLNSILKNYQEAINKVSKSEKSSIENEIQNIINSIPEEINPKATLNFLEKKAPDLYALILKTDSPDSVQNCLKGDDSICGKLLDGKNKEGLSQIVNKQLIDSESELGKNYHPVKEKIDKKLTDDLNKVFYDFDKPLEGLEHNSMVKVQNTFKKNEKIIKRTYKTLGLDDSSYNEMIKNCSVSETEEMGNKKELCEKNLADLVHLYDAKASDINSSIQNEEDKLKKELKDVLSGDNLNRIQRIEKMKQFTMVKYLRECPDATQAPKSNIIEASCAVHLENPSSQLSDLATDFTNAIGVLKNGKNVSKTPGENGTFSKDELDVYSNYCQNMNKNEVKAVKETCKDVRGYKSAIADKRELKDWQEFNEKYYVQYDSNPRNHNHYVAIEKKSNSRIFAEGLAQSVNQLYPIWFTDMNLTGQIDFMTNQALYQSQLTYMYNPTSPWMMQGYFQGNYLATPPSTMPISTIPAGAGFNLGP